MLIACDRCNKNECEYSIPGGIDLIDEHEDYYIDSCETCFKELRNMLNDWWNDPPHVKKQ